jgi:hypothetical protein
MTADELKDALERLASKPDTALENSKVGAAFLNCSERTLRYHPAAERIYVTPRTYRYTVGNLRQIAKRGVR